MLTAWVSVRVSDVVAPFVGWSADNAPSRLGARWRGQGELSRFDASTGFTFSARIYPRRKPIRGCFVLNEVPVPFCAEHPQQKARYNVSPTLLRCCSALTHVRRRKQISGHSGNDGRLGSWEPAGSCVGDPRSVERAGSCTLADGSAGAA